MGRPHDPGPCDGCCTCPAPYIATASRSASKSKGGAGCSFVGGDGKYYLVQTISTTIDNGCNQPDATCGGGITASTTGSMTVTNTINPSTCTHTTTCTGSASGSSAENDYSQSHPPEGGIKCTLTTAGSGNATWTLNSDCSTWSQTYTESQSHYNGDGDFLGTTGGTSTSTTTGIPTLNTNCGRSPLVTFYDHGSTTTTYSDEYTTALLKAATVEALPSWPALSSFSAGTGGEVASAELSSDESTYSIMESKYQWAHKISPTRYYKLTWVERFQPDGGGAPTDTARSYTWDGTTPGGYDPTDSSTWPKSSVFEVDYPSSNGTISIANLVELCIAPA